MKAIIAINKKLYIGKNGKLMWHCPEDLTHFKELTDGCKLLVGYNTYKNLPNLKNREIVVDKRGPELVDTNDIDWCIGGKKTYEKYGHLFTEIHVSNINNDEFGDTGIPNLNLREDCKIFNDFFCY